MLRLHVEELRHRPNEKTRWDSSRPKCDVYCWICHIDSHMNSPVSSLEYALVVDMGG